MQTYIAVLLGGAIGSGLRFWLAGWVAHRFGNVFPWGVLCVNIIGCFVIGCFSTLTNTEGALLVSPLIRQLVMIGILGGFTTFSSFSLETLRLAQDGEWLYAGANVLLSVALCLLAVWMGHLFASAINHR